MLGASNEDSTEFVEQRHTHTPFSRKLRKPAEEMMLAEGLG